MLTQLLLENFQIHKKTVLEFVRGVNIITGPSDNGKSSLVRALRWAVQNRPSGTSMLKKDTEECSVSCISFAGGGSISRVRGPKDNYYMRRTGPDDTNTEKLQALRSDVPTEISTIANLSPHSLQGQHDPYFLLQMSPGEAAKLFGELADLSIIAKTTVAASKYIKAIKDQQGILVAEEQDYKEQFYALDHLTEAVPLADLLEADTTKLETARSAHHRLTEALARFAATQTHIEALEGRLRAKTTLVVAQELSARHQQMTGRATALNAALLSLASMERKMNTATAQLDQKAEIEELAGMVATNQKQKDMREKLARVMLTYSTCMTQCTTVSARLEQANKDFAAYRQTIGVCPLCERPWGQA